MRILYISDLHGSMKHYEAAFQQAGRRDCGALVFGGDLAPKNFRDGKFVEHQVAWHRDALMPRLEQFRLRRPATRVFFILGNDDSRAAEAVFAARDGDVLEYVHLKSVELEKGLTLLGYSCVDISPFPLKDFERWDRKTVYDKVRNLNGVVTDGTQLKPFRFDPEPGSGPFPTLEDELAPLEAGVRPGVSIVVTHCPPYRSKLDKMMLGKHVGSESVRDFVERTRPAISLHGHIHESPQMTGDFKDSIGSTVCVNPGQDPYKGIVNYVVFDSDAPARTLEHVVER